MPFLQLFSPAKLRIYLLYISYLSIISCRIRFLVLSVQNEYAVILTPFSFSPLHVVQSHSIIVLIRDWEHGVLTFAMCNRCDAISIYSISTLEYSTGLLSLKHFSLCPFERRY